MKRDILLLVMAVAFILGLRFFHTSVHSGASDSNGAGLLIWSQLLQTKIHTDYVHGVYLSAEFPAGVKALVGKEVVVAGFMVPLEITAKSSHFILSRRTPTCPFCPPGDPNEVIDVETLSPMVWTEDKMVLSGTFELINNTQAGLFFKLAKAKQL